MASLLPIGPRTALFSATQAYAGALAMLAASTLVGLWIAPHWGTAAVDLVYLPAVLAAAALWGLGPALFAAAGAALAYNFFFTEPVHTFRMDRATDIVTVIVLLLVALVTSQLASAMRAQARLAAGHAARNATIAGFARRLLSCSGEVDIALIACTELRTLFDCNATLVAGLPEPQAMAMVPDGNRLTPSDLAAAALTIQSGEPAGRGTARLQPAEWQFHPVSSDGGVLAAAGLARDDGAASVSEEGLPLLGNLLDQLALALERAQFDARARELAALHERDRVRSALLATIGTDLKPPLAAIGGALRSLRRSGTADRATVSVIGGEALKLERYIDNLVDVGTESGHEPITAGGVVIDLFTRSVAKNGREVHLTPKEYLVLAELAKHRGRVLSHQHLLRSAWGPAQENQTEYLRVAIRALRQKLEARPDRPRLILNEPGVGYRLGA